jgi:methionyl aminopeptidase
MSIQSVADWKGLREVGRIVRLVLDALEAAVRAGMTTAELDAVAARVVRKHRAQSAPKLVYGFPGTVLISINDEIVHGVPGRRQILEGDVVKLDVTLEKDGYMADAARTVVVGEGSEVAQRLRACAESSFARGLAAARLGARVSDIGRAIESEVRAFGFSVVRELQGHGIGRTIHEEPSVPNFYDPRQTDVLTEGLVVAIEPLIAAGSARLREDAGGWTIRTRDGSLTAHYEHTVVITQDRPVLLTAA